MNMTQAKKESVAQRKKRALIVLKKLVKEYKFVGTKLFHKNVFQLLVVTILSAQCTDVRVNIVAPVLFKKFKTPNDFATANLKDIKKIIKSTGFYNNKAKNIKNSSKKIVSDFNGKVPKTLNELITLPGVGRKTANIILSYGFGLSEGIAVDTHVKRLSNRLFFSFNSNPDKIEHDLLRVFVKKDWSKVNSTLIWHGRKICNARNPKCQNCLIKQYCPSFFRFVSSQ